MAAWLDRYQRRHSWLGFPLAVLYKFLDDRGPYLAAMVTYYGFISLFPLTLLFLTALGFFLEANPGAYQHLVQTTVGDLPVIGPQLQRNVSGLRGSGTRLALSVLGALYGGLGAMQAAQAGFNHVYGVPRNEQPDPLRSRLRSLGLLLTLGSAVLLSAAAATFVAFAHELTGRSGPGLQVLGYLLTFVINAGLFTAALQLLTARTLRVRQVIVGGLIAATSWMALQTFGARFIAERLSRTSALYGTFGLVLAALAWIYLQSVVLMFCAEINVTANDRLWPRALLTPFTDDVDLTDADRRIYTTIAAAQRFKDFETVSVGFDRPRAASPGSGEHARSASRGSWSAMGVAMTLFGPSARRGDHAARWLARAAFALALAAAGLLLAAGGLRGLVLLAAAVAGLGAGLAGAWGFLAFRGARRAAAGAVVVAAAGTVVLLYARAGLLLPALVCVALWAAAVTVAGAALRRAEPAVPDVAARRAGHPFLVMNPRSGGGKVVEHDLAGRARALGAEVVLLDGGQHVDVAELARHAVRSGADLLGVAGGDGTQAAVAQVAVEHDVPFMVIAAGTRNHFAMDLGLDRAHPAQGLAALTDGVEVRVDVGWAGERMFVNNASFGAYAAVVQSPGYRDDKTATALEVLPDLLTGQHGTGLRLHAAGADVAGAQAVLVSSNPYATTDIAGLGRRERLDGGVLGVLAVTVNSPTDAARLVRGSRSGRLTRATAGEAVIESDEPSIPAGLDGESVRLPTPVRCRVQPGALRVRVPRLGPSRRARPRLDWRLLWRLAFAPGRAR